jgi:hypothetical protein
MALYKYADYLAENDDAAFDQINHPATSAPHSGIYRCEGCGWEVASNGGQPLPPQNHHQHTQQQGWIRWRLVTFAQHLNQ